MGFIKSFIANKQAKSDVELLAEEKVYEYVGNEIASGDIRSGLWTKATSVASSSDPADIEREYIRLRVELLLAEGRLYNRFLREVSEAEVEEVAEEAKLEEVAEEAELEEIAEEEVTEESEERYVGVEIAIGITVIFLVAMAFAAYVDSTVTLLSR